MIIAELCQNHLGSRTRLLEMVRVAAECGAWGAKIQTFFASDLADSWRDKPAGVIAPTEYERLKKLELSWDDHRAFVEACTKHHVIPMTSIYSPGYLGDLKNAGFHHIKIGSAQGQDHALITAAIGFGMKAYVSTGGAEIKDIPRVGPLACLFHCVSKYPHDDTEAGLARMLDIKKSFPGVPVGFSDHSEPNSTRAAFTALALGATYIERHFRLDGVAGDARLMKDYPVSVGPEVLRRLCAFDRAEESARHRMWLDYGLYRSPDEVVTKSKELISVYQHRWKQ